MGDRNEGHRPGTLDATDFAPPDRRAGIALGGEHDAKRGFCREPRRTLRQPLLDAGEEQTKQILLKTRQHGLGFGIAETRIVFDEPWTIRANHQTGEKDALEGRVHRRHSLERGRDDRPHDAFAHPRIHHRRRRIGTHAPGVGAALAFTDALVILRGSELHCPRAIAKREKRNLLAVEKILDDDSLSRLAKFARKHPVYRGVRLVYAHRHDNALARREPVGLDDDRRTFAAHIGSCRGGAGKAGISGGWDFEAGAKLLGEGFGAFEPGRSLAWTENLNSSRRQIVGNARDQRCLWANHDEIDAIRLAKSGDRRMVLYVERDVPRERRHAGIARRGEQRFQQRARRERDGDGMLASAGAEKKNVHDRVV